MSDSIVEMKTGTHDRGTTFFPLYRYEGVLGGELQKVCNLKPKFVSMWKEVTKREFVQTGAGDGMRSTGPDDVFSWLYGLFHSNAYRARFSAALARGFPVVLLPGSSAVLQAVAALGSQLIAIHTMDTVIAKILESPTIRFAGAGEARVEKGFPEYTNGKVMINASRWFEDVPKPAWDSYVGGYQVCHKWLKDRASRGGKRPSLGRVLTDEDVLHYRRIVVALTETRRLMVEIDRVIDQHGGWPGAFAGNTE
jgi:predicted helicase